ncbi:unnamed protein product [Rotaria sordida]|uniref:N-acetyltransferase domain-containing protein n=1 Tax=Rotaria sordida TaxID=392033 RepID=A0A815D630_9BILA|nr:unnamed protein product [Rotaria sordida]
MFTNLTYFHFGLKDICHYPPTSFIDFLSPTCYPSNLIHLNVGVRNLNDCLCLLDGRLCQLQTFIVEIDYICNASIIINNTTNNELIGGCGFRRSVKNERRTEIGYWLGEPYWHRGLMPKIVKKVIEIIKNEWKNLVRIEAKIFPWNKASMRVAEKCGFVFEGVLRKRTHKNGQDIDEHLYALIIE